MAPPPCLCLFDIDRTLTGKQCPKGQVGCEADKNCPSNRVHPGTTDWAYGSGTLSTSALAEHLGDTPCKACYLGILTAGDASGEKSPERKLILEYLRNLPLGSVLPSQVELAFRDANLPRGLDAHFPCGVRCPDLKTCGRLDIGDGV